MRPLLPTVAIAAALVISPTVAARQASPRNASYTLAATLDPVNHLIAGTGRLTWRNEAAMPATELRFHMYWNGWRTPSSTWLREQRLGLNATLARRTGADVGWIDLTKAVRIDRGGDRDLLPAARYITPDDGNEYDQTVLSVPLDQPVGPGQTVAIDLGWNARVPRPFQRTGVLGRYFFVAHWFPKVGVFTDAGWNAHQFHAATEFFADYGSYDVQLTVPSGWTVGATGRETSRTDHGNGTTTHRYAQDDVHDFAWTTSPDFLDVRQRIDEPGRPGVDVRLLLQPEHRDQANRHFDAVRATLQRFGAWFGPYPYGHLTVVDPVAVFNPTAQGASTGGMEYPTLITAGTRWVAPWRGPDPESVTIHEAGHQFWHGVVGTNEFEHAWMDEGLTTYATARVIAETVGDRFVTVERYFGGLVPWPYQDVRWSRDVTGNRLAAYRIAPAWDAGATPTWRQWPAAARSVTYAKTALWLTSLERIVGWATMQKILAAFFEKGAFRHPTPDEFMATASEVSGRDLTWFFDAVHRSAATFDYAVADVISERTDGGARDSTIIVRRLGEGVFPVDVRTTFDDGSSVTERWDGAERWRAFRYRQGAAVRTVEIDPDRVLTLDLNFTNNSWTSQPRAADASQKWALRWLTWLESVLLTYAFFA